jgi:predicted Holliday junction resolvase-like endonuclease
MNLRKEAKKVIHTLEANRFYAECPCPECERDFLLKDAGLFYFDDFSQEAEKLYQQRLNELKEQEMEYREKRRRIPQRSQISAKAGNIGFILERIAPSLRMFPFERNDCRSLFDPIDYIVFQDLSKKGIVNKVIFMDIKTGGGKPSGRQLEIRSLVERGRVVWKTYQTEVR